jgi:hypothetical protein
VEFPNDWLTHR